MKILHVDQSSSMTMLTVRDSEGGIQDVTNISDVPNGDYVLVPLLEWERERREAKDAQSQG